MPFPYKNACSEVAFDRQGSADGWRGRHQCIDTIPSTEIYRYECECYYFVHLEKATFASESISSEDNLADPQCRDITQYLTSSVQELGIGTYISSDPPVNGEGDAPNGSPDQKSSHPIYTATMQTTVFDVVHMFSEQGISAVPIVDEDGKVLNLYETVDVIVS